MPPNRLRPCCTPRPFIALYHVYARMHSSHHLVAVWLVPFALSMCCRVAHWRAGARCSVGSRCSTTTPRGGAKIAERERRHDGQVCTHLGPADHHGLALSFREHDEDTEFVVPHRMLRLRGGGSSVQGLRQILAHVRDHPTLLHDHCHGTWYSACHYLGRGRLG